MDKEELKNIIDPNRKNRPVPTGQMNLGSIVKLLGREKLGASVTTSDGDSIGLPYSYTNHPMDLAFSPSAFPITVSELIKICHDTMNRTFHGSFKMTHATLVWVSKIGDLTGKAVIDVIHVDGSVKLLLKNITQDKIKELL